MWVMVFHYGLPLVVVGWDRFWQAVRQVFGPMKLVGTVMATCPARVRYNEGPDVLGSSTYLAINSSSRS